MERINVANKAETYLSDDKLFMSEAILIARGAFESGNFPVGCVIECNGKIIADGARTGTVGKNPNEIDHAEINALKKLSGVISEFPRSRMSLYSTLEPCLMCFGAILLSGISRIVFAYEDVMGGATKCDLSKLPILYSNSVPSIISGVLRSESLDLFKSFFSDPNNNYWSNSELSLYTLEN